MSSLRLAIKQSLEDSMPVSNVKSLTRKSIHQPRTAKLTVGLSDKELRHRKGLERKAASKDDDDESSLRDKRGGTERKGKDYRNRKKRCKFGCGKWVVSDGVCVAHGGKVRKCSHEGCTNNSLKGGVCIRHGVKVGQCSHNGCTKNIVKGGVCVRHGAKLKRCRQEGCSKIVTNNGVCMRHGAVAKKCSFECCSNNAVLGGVCIRHGAIVKRCTHEGCTHYAQQRGVCKTHGAVVKRKYCTREGCGNFVQRKGFCRRHGKHLTTARAKVVRCKYEGCTSHAQYQEMCWNHRLKPDIVTPSEVMILHMPAEEQKSRTADSNGQGDSHLTSYTALNLSDDDICAWIWKSSSMARRGKMDDVEEAVK